ncbi:alpha/beta fold hydrolase [Virgibacillus halodenitrificans]|uniref:alpha/beta fold hydrolase n=1 Tax=Virgibacillus halodenitrificans TaxID=1482 RepID=UPI001F224F1C|nr:alpha/beta fold hydrolase [Virgibacillus halodenitrificans]
MSLKKKQLTGITFISLAVVGVVFLLYVPDNTQSEYEPGIPTVFVHGYKGTANSFDFMLNRFENKYNWGNKAIVYYVSASGKVEEHNLNKGRKEPTFIQVVFQNNRASFATTSFWLASVLQQLKEKYEVEKVNLVGHSMGGIVSLKYIKEYNEKAYPSVANFVTIGSPYDGIYSDAYFRIHHDPAAEDLKPQSNGLKRLREGEFPKGINVLSIASTGDTVAVPESVHALRSIIPSNQLEEVVIEDPELGHSALHENVQIDQLIHSFLWQDRDQ